MPYSSDVDAYEEPQYACSMHVWSAHLVEADVLGKAASSDGIKQSQGAESIDVALSIANSAHASKCSTVSYGVLRCIKARSMRIRAQA